MRWVWMLVVLCWVGTAEAIKCPGGCVGTPASASTGSRGIKIAIDCQCDWEDTVNDNWTRLNDDGAFEDTANTFSLEQDFTGGIAGGTSAITLHPSYAAPTAGTSDNALLNFDETLSLTGEQGFALIRLEPNFTFTDAAPFTFAYYFAAEGSWTKVDTSLPTQDDLYFVIPFYSNIQYLSTTDGVFPWLADTVMDLHDVIYSGATTADNPGNAIFAVDGWVDVTVAAQPVIKATGDGDLTGMLRTAFRSLTTIGESPASGAGRVTVDELFSFHHMAQTVHSGNTVTDIVGFECDNNTGGTNRYCVRAHQAADGTAAWNIYADGTAPNFFEGDVEFDSAINHDGTTIGFFGVAPTTRASAYNVTNEAADRAYDANSGASDTDRINELADVLGTLINDLALYGLTQ